MGSTYADTQIDLMYDFDAIVKSTNPSEEILKVSRIRSAKYLTISGKEGIFPNDFLSKVEGLRYESLKVGLRQSSFQKERCIQKNLEETAVDEVFPVAIFCPVINVEEELKKKRIPMIDSTDYLFFRPGELEEKLKKEKIEFLKKLQICGFNAKESEIYLRLAATNLNFWGFQI